jgi:hypothetical protein
VSGVTGIQGVTGLIGITGLQGATGVSGVTGNYGVTGFIGLTGVQGHTGAQGYTGSQGCTGTTGVTGIQGATGLSQGVTGVLSLIIDGGGVELVTGIRGDFRLPYNLMIDDWTITANPTGSVLIGIWNSSYANFPPTPANAMHVGATGPFIKSGIKNQSTTANWGSPTGAAGSMMRISVDSASLTTQVSISLGYYAF